MFHGTVTSLPGVHSTEMSIWAKSTFPCIAMSESDTEIEQDEQR